MRVTDLGPEPIYTLPCLQVCPGGKDYRRKDVPVLSGAVDALPEGLDALLVTSDLQFIDTDAAPVESRRLFGEVVARELGTMADLGLLPDPARTGVLLAGDLYARRALDARGGIGDVTGVWRAFDDAFAWVAGVAGNHDDFRGKAERPRAMTLGSPRLLDGDTATFGGLTVGGVCGVIGAAPKPWRRPEADFVTALIGVLGAAPDVLVLHESPRSPSPDHRGRGKASLTRAILEHAHAEAPPLVISGHVGWPDPLDEVEGGPQFLNVEERVVLLTRERLGPI
jgi:hypothetical protein